MAQTPVRTDARYAGTKVHAEEWTLPLSFSATTTTMDMNGTAYESL